MAILNIVVADLLIGQGLVSLGELDVVVIERLDSLVLGSIRSDLVRVELDGQALVVGFYLLFCGGLRALSVKSMLRVHALGPRGHKHLKYPEYHRGSKFCSQQGSSS